MQPKRCRATAVHKAVVAFTRAELLVILAVLALLALVVLPALANTRPRSARVICANNLRQIGMAMQLWGNDHGDRPPYEVELNEGGTRRHPLAANTWFHFAWLSNELASPQLLLCPSDSGRPAHDFTGNPDTGYLHSNYRNRATSYFLTYRIFATSLRVQVGDRNVRFTAAAAGCSVFNNAWAISGPYLGSDYGWTNGLHQNSGNYLTFDGVVEQASNQAFRDVINQGSTGSDNTSLHFSVPR